MIHLKTILLPIDFSDVAHQAEYVADVFARMHSAKLVVTHVVRPPTCCNNTCEVTHEREELMESARRCLISAIPSVADRDVEFSVLSGDPGEEIVNAARRIHADLIVLGTHRRSNENPKVLGDVAEQVIRNAPCAVLIIKPGPGWEPSQLLRQPGSAPPACSL